MFQYTAVTIDAGLGHLKEELNNYGKIGWRLFQILVEPEGHFATLVFERPEVTGNVKLSTLIASAMQTDGCHHKQWYLAQIAKSLGIDVSDLDQGIAP